MHALLKLFILAVLCSTSTTVAQPLVDISPTTSLPPSDVVCTWAVLNSEVVCNGISFHHEVQDRAFSTRWFIDMAIVGVLVVFAGISSGLTVGLIGLDYTTLEVLSKSGTPREQQAARLILPIVSNHHLLLVTLLLATSTAEEAMPLVLDRMMPAWLSIIVSVILVLIFAEVIPMALCTRYGLDVGAKLSWLVKLFIIICYPIAWPISKVLDWLFGHSAGTLFKRSQLKELINMHSRHSIQTAEDVEAELRKLPVEERLTSHEVQLIKNALDLNARLAIELSTPIDEVYMLEHSQICDREVIGAIVLFGLHYSVPVYKENRDQIIGVIRVGDLISLSPEANTPISALELDDIVKLPSSTPVYHAMTHMQLSKASIAILVDPQLHRIPVAVLTMEDIVEELVRDQFADMPIFPASAIDAPNSENLLDEWMQPVDSSGESSVQSGSSTKPLLIESTTHDATTKNSATNPAKPVFTPPPRPIFHQPQQLAAMRPDGAPPRPLRQTQSIPRPPKTPPMPSVRSPNRPAGANQQLGSNADSNHIKQPHQSLQMPFALELGANASNKLGTRPLMGIPSQQLRQSSSFDSISSTPAFGPNNGKLIPVTHTDFETSSVGSDSSYSSTHSAKSFPASFGHERDDFACNASQASTASTASAASAIAFTRPAPKKKKTKPKDPTVSARVEKKLNTANIIGTALKRSNSSLNSSTNSLLPIIYKRNIAGDAVVDPTKLLSASHGDIHETPEVPSVRVLSASLEQIPPTDEDTVTLDW